jgi:ferritin
VERKFIARTVVSGVCRRRQEIDMIKPTILSALDKQIQHEQSNAHAYEAVSLYFGRLNLHGLEMFMAHQVQDERMHAQRLVEHVKDRGGQVQLLAIPAPRTEFASPLEAVNSVRDLERATTEAIHRLYELARKEGDHALEVRLHWFITEQVEEEQWSSELAALMQQFHQHPGQLFVLDHQWGKRVKDNGT